MLYRYRHSHDHDDLEKVVRARDALTRLVSPASPDMVKYLNNLGLSLLASPDLAAEPSSSARATETFRQACSIGLETNPAEVLKVAATWGDWAAERAKWTDSAAAFGFGIVAIETLFRTQPLRRHKEAWLASIGDMAVGAAYALTRASTTDQAVAALERGRSTLLSEALARNSANLHQLEERGYAQLAERFMRTAARLGRLSTATGDL